MFAPAADDDEDSGERDDATGTEETDKEVFSDDFEELTAAGPDFGDELNEPVETGIQIPEQSAPPFSGSQLSDGSSIHSKPGLHRMPVIPPQITNERAEASPLSLESSMSVTYSTLIASALPWAVGWTAPLTSTRLPRYVSMSRLASFDLRSSKLPSGRVI